MRGLGLGLALGKRGIVAEALAVISGLTDGFAIIGDHATLTVSDGLGGTVTARKWGSTSGGSEYGTGTSPTDYTAGDGGLLYATITVDGEDYTTSATIAYAAGTAPAVADGQSWTVDDTAVNLDGSASGANLTFSYALSGAPSEITINSSTGAITGTVSYATGGASGSGTATITATDQYGRALTDTFTWSYALRTQATAAGGLGPYSFTQDVAISAQDLSADFTANGNTLTYAIAGTALPAGLSVSSAGSMTGTPTTVTASASYTVRATDEYGRTTDSTFTLEVVDVELTAFTLTDNSGSTPDEVSITSSEAGNIYGGVYPDGTTINDVTPANLVAGTDTGQLDDFLIGELLAGGSLTDVDINPTGLTGGTTYFLAVVQDINNGGTYTNVVGGNFVENVTFANGDIFDGRTAADTNPDTINGGDATTAYADQFDGGTAV